MLEFRPLSAIPVLKGENRGRELGGSKRVRSWGAKLDINDGRALDLCSEREDNGASAAFLRRRIWSGGSASRKLE